MRSVYRKGDWVIYSITKRSPRPGPRARNVYPEPHGDQYLYQVDKFWIVDDVKDDELHLRTRTGKLHIMSSADRDLRHANLLERMIFRQRFLQTQRQVQSAT